MLLCSSQCWETILGDKEKSNDFCFHCLSLSTHCHLLQLLFDSFSSYEGMNAFVQWYMTVHSSDICYQHFSTCTMMCIQQFDWAEMPIHCMIWTPFCSAVVIVIFSSQQTVNPLTKLPVLWIAQYFIVWQPWHELLLYTSNIVAVTCSFTSYSWYTCIFLLKALQLKVSTNTRFLLTMYCFTRDKNTVLPQLAFCKMLAIIYLAIPVHIQNTWVSMLSTRVQDYVHNSQTCGLWPPL